MANPGHVPWFGRAARALDSAGLLGTYLAPFAAPPAWAPSRLRARLAARASIGELPPARLRSAGSFREAAAIAGRRVAPGSALARRLAAARDQAIDHRAAALLSESGAALLCYGAALETATRARATGVPAAIEQAVHHHEFNRRILGEEVRRCPAGYARTMQFHNAPRERDARLDRELRVATKVIALSRFSRRTFVEAGVDEARVIVNQLGVDVDRWATEREDAARPFRVAFVGVLTQRKGLSYAVEGFAHAAIPGSELVLAGAPVGDARPWRGVRGVTERPWLDQQELARLFATTDALVLPSLVEGLARVILEAMAAGVPAIVTPNTGGEDVITDGVDGYVVPIRDTGAIAERLLALSRNADLWRSMSVAARSRARDFDWRAYGRRTVANMRAMVEES